MSEETNMLIDKKPQEEATNPASKVIKKRDIFRFCTQTEDMAIDLGKVFKIMRTGKRIMFQVPIVVPVSYDKPGGEWIEFEEEEAAQRAFEQIIAIWSADVVE